MKFENYRPSLQILRLIGELDEFNGSWRSISAINPERLASLKRVATIESIGSSTRIEGASLSDQEVEALLSGLRTKKFRSRDEEEVAGYADLMETIYANWENIAFTENYIKQLYGVLLKHSSKDDRHRGNYKTIANHVVAVDENGISLGTVFKTASPFETPFKMTALVDWMRTAIETGEIHPLLVNAVFTVEFLAIHPFQDGNGRLSRCLTNLLLLKTGYTYVPYSSLESVIESSKESYYLALRRTQITLDNEEPDWDSWIIFFLQSMQQQKRKLEEKIKRGRILQGDLPSLSIRILEITREEGTIKSSALETLTGEKKSTILARLNELVAHGHLSRHGKGPATWYTVKQVDL